jgi:hypothetical protein
MNRFWIAAWVAALIALGAAPSRAEEREQDGESPTSSWSDAVQQASLAGGFLPLSLAPSVGQSAALSSGTAGYDSAKGAPSFESFAEARVFGPFALRVGTRLNDGNRELAPFVGGRVQLLTQARHGVDGALAAFYKTEGFTETEGEVEVLASVGGRIGSVLLIGNLAYGQDAEGRERDGELRAASLVRVAPKLQLGVDARARFDLGSMRARLVASQEPTYDLDAGPLLVFAVGPLALSAQVGASVVRRLDRMAELGAVALGGLGTAF